MPGGRSRHQLILLTRHFHLSGLTACITQPRARAACMRVDVFSCVCSSACERAKNSKLSDMSLGDVSKELHLEDVKLFVCNKIRPDWGGLL